MLTRVIKGLIALAVLVLCVYLVIYAFGVLGIAIPASILPIIWLIVLLLALLLFVGILSGRLTFDNWL